MKTELEKTLDETPPKWIVTKNFSESESDLPDFLENDLADNYLLHFQNSGYCL